VRVGDVISFDHPGASTEIVSHRVIEVLQVKGRTVFRTKGDHNPKADDWKVDYVGQRGWKVVAHAPYLGAVMYAAQSHLVRITLVVVPVAALLLLTLRSIRGGAPTPTPRPELRAQCSATSRRGPA
ncbi:MAG: signal peptidase I, partial [Thermoleophilia bacterium]|nr:signal peptidase I [Thermoleophilia bacterium]